LRHCAKDQRRLYNAALEERIDCYRKTGRSLTNIDQCKSLTLCRRDLAEMGHLPVNLQRWTLKRLDEAFQGFFRRHKAQLQSWISTRPASAEAISAARRP